MSTSDSTRRDKCLYNDDYRIQAIFHTRGHKNESEMRQQMGHAHENNGESEFPFHSGISAQWKVSKEDKDQDGMA